MAERTEAPAISPVNLTAPAGARSHVAASWFKRAPHPARSFVCMAPFIVLVGLFGLFLGLGAAGVHTFGGWLAPLRFALAGMFLLNASAHWGKRRPDLVRMVPPRFPRPELLVTLTGVLELLGAIGLLLPRTAGAAAGGLGLLLVALFPANVHAARAHLTLDGRPVPALGLRAALQVVFVAAAVAVAIGSGLPR